MAQKQAHFGRTFFEFLEDLKANNNSEWFKANKERYIDEVRTPLQQFVLDFAPHLKKISPHFVADPRPVGGSIFRIYRDIRFSKDKTPYKTHAAAQFRHKGGKDVHAPGFYLHLAPGEVFAGFGIWRPDSPSLESQSPAQPMPAQAVRSLSRMADCPSPASRPVSWRRRREW